MSIRIENLSKTFGTTEVLQPLDLQVSNGEMLALLGPSGSGKTTLLRMIAGLESCEQGNIFFDDKEVTNIHVRNRNIGFVFQHYALFQHMTVAQNIAFGLDVLPRKHRPNKQAITAKVNELLTMIQLEHLAERFPSQLSGGQKQRVALARALATEPEILLLDEPFGALDAQVRKDLRHWLRHLHEQLNFTSIFVTHDQEEAFEVSDRVAILNNGTIEQIDSPTTLFNLPANRFVFDFLGAVNCFKGTIQQQKLISDGAIINLETDTATGNADLYFRAHEIHPSTTPQLNNNLTFTVQHITPIGAEIRISLIAENFKAHDDWQVVVSHTEYSQLQLQKGDSCYMSLQTGHLFIADQQKPINLNWSNQNNQYSAISNNASDVQQIAT